MPYRLQRLQHKHSHPGSLPFLVYLLSHTFFFFYSRICIKEHFSETGLWIFLFVETAVILGSYHVPHCALSCLCHVMQTEKESASLFSSSNNITHRTLKLSQLLYAGLVKGHLCFFCSSSHDVLIEQRVRVVCKGVDETSSLFLTAWRELKPSASGSRHFIPLAQTAPEIGPVFVRGSNTEMQPPPPSLVPVRLRWSAGVSEVERSVCYVITESVWLIKTCKKHAVVIPHGFCI